MKKKVLVIRFSSFGDIVQCLASVSAIKRDLKDCEIYFATKSDFSELVASYCDVDEVLAFDKRDGLIGLIRFALMARKHDFDYVYDAHSNIRSKILIFILKFFGKKFQFARRYKDRVKRILLFVFKKNLFPTPFRGIFSYIAPLLDWGVSKKIGFERSWEFSKEIDLKTKSLIEGKFQQKDFVAIVPSAAWKMKRWPADYWSCLIAQMPDCNFVVLGGPGDIFCQEFEKIDESRVLNLAGKLSLLESCRVIQNSSLTISGDTGLLHVADLMGIKTIALIGPTAFGFPSGQNVSTLEIDLICRPCSKDGSGKCISKVYQQCMMDISPQMVSEKSLALLD